jgi:drug/metabolite transporter (DMT)-like permease
VVALLAMINLVVAWRSNTIYRRWWLAAGAAMTVYALASYGYFVPQMLAFQSAGDSWTPRELETFVTWWTWLNFLRMAIGGIGWLCALRALSWSGTARSTNATVAQPIS